MYWMKEQCKANSGHARKAYEILKAINLNRMSHATAPTDQLKIAPLLLLPSPEKPVGFNSNQKFASIKSIDLPSKPARLAIQAEPNAVVASKLNLVRSNALNKQQTIHENDAFNQRLYKLKNQLNRVHDTTNRKMIELQSELGKVQKMSHEFNVLAECMVSQEKWLSIDENLNRLQKTIRLTEQKVHQIHTNSHKVRQIIEEISEAAQKQSNSNEKAVIAIGERLTRWELKMDRLTHKISNHKFDSTGRKLPGTDYEQLKGDIENMLNGRLNGLSTDIEMMKNVMFGIVVLVIFKAFVFELIFKEKLNFE